MVGGAVVLCVYSTEDVREVSVPSSQFCCELKTALKSQVCETTKQNRTKTFAGIATLSVFFFTINCGKF